MDTKSKAYRTQILKIVDAARRGHIGSALSIIEIVRVLYDDILHIDPKRPLWTNRDRFILSKGHGCLALYVALAEKGFFPKKELVRFCAPGALLGGHPQYGKIPGIEASTGSLGHGLPVAVGIALHAQLNAKNYRTFVLLGDGECQEGTVWEAALCASKHELDSLTVLVDYNQMQCFSRLCEVQDLEPFLDKWASFGFAVAEIDGHNLTDLKQTLSHLPLTQKKPSLILCHTTKGKGFPTIENNPLWHHQSKISDSQMQILFNELEQL